MLDRIVPFVVLLILPAGVHAQCLLEGAAEVADVTPRGADLRFGVAEEARVSLEGARAAVEGLSPVAFEGRARARDVSVYLGAARTLRGVLEVEAGVEVEVVRERGGRVAGWITAGPSRISVSLGCANLSLSASTDSSEADEPEDTEAVTVVQPRGRVLRAYASAEATSAAELRLRPGATREEWPELRVLGASGTRIHVRSELDRGVRLDAWVERDTVRSDGTVSGCACDSASGVSGCGHSYASQSYLGPARIAAGTELRDAVGHVWGHVVVETSLVVAVSTITVGWRSTTGESGTTRQDTVWVESLPGLVADPCGGLAAQVDRDAVTLPTDG